MPGRSFPQIPASEHQRQVLRSLACLLITALFVAVPAYAEVRVVNASGEYRMGDRDTREDAVRIATEAAKRSALEQVATYLESVTVVDGMDVTKDEIRTYTAGLVLVLEQQTNTSLDRETVVVKVDLVAQIDTEEVGSAITALRENEDARQQLVALKQENEQLQQDLDAANQALAQASTSDQAQQVAQQRQDILNRVQSNAMVSQAWTDWVLVSPVVYPNPWIGLAQTHALLNVARTLYPTSPHVTAAQQVITTRQPPTPPAPPAPGSAPHGMPGYQTVPPPGSQGPPRTLNEITHRTPTVPPQIGNQPGGHALTDAHQLNPLNPMLQPGVGQQQSHATMRMQQFLNQNPGFGQTPGSVPQMAPGGQPPMPRRLPPTINQIHPPLPQQVPRAPFQMAPRPFGGGGHGGGGGGRSGGGGRGGGRGR